VALVVGDIDEERMRDNIRDRYGSRNAVNESCQIGAMIDRSRSVGGTTLTGLSRMTCSLRHHQHVLDG